MNRNQRLRIDFLYLYQAMIIFVQSTSIKELFLPPLVKLSPVIVQFLYFRHYLALAKYKNVAQGFIF